MVKDDANRRMLIGCDRLYRGEVQLEWEGCLLMTREGPSSLLTPQTMHILKIGTMFFTSQDNTCLS